MTSMPTIDDRMVVELRRTGRRQATYSRARGSRVVSNGSRVVPQSAVCARKPDCSGPCHVFPDGTPLYCMGQECTATAAQCNR
jgi:hypothetical protein